MRLEPTERQCFDTLVILGLTMLVSPALCQTTNSSSPKSPFPSREAICSPIYGVSETGSVSYCPARFGQCLKAEGDALARLGLTWPTIEKKVREKCQSDARSKRAIIYQTYPLALALAENQGHAGSYSVLAVETCIATRLKQPLPPPMEPLPSACSPSAVTLPSGEAQSAAEQCAFPNFFAHPDVHSACLKAEASAKSRLAKIIAFLTTQIVTSCVRAITGKGFDQNTIPYRTSSFVNCATKAIQYRNLSE